MFPLWLFHWYWLLISNKFLVVNLCVLRWRQYYLRIAVQTIRLVNIGGYWEPYIKQHIILFCPNMCLKSLSKKDNYKYLKMITSRNKHTVICLTAIAHCRCHCHGHFWNKVFVLNAIIEREMC